VLVSTTDMTLKAIAEQLDVPVTGLGIYVVFFLRKKK